jgi:hypothetical protein
MKTNQLPAGEKSPSGKTILRRFNKDGSLQAETHGYGILDIAIEFSFSNEVKTQETYFVKKRLVSRRSYEKARVNYSDMPPANNLIEDFSSGLLQDLRAHNKQRKLEAEKRLAESEESRFPRPQSTNWLRVIAKNKAHLVEFASRDWKLLSGEASIPSGREWLRQFGFSGSPGGKSDGSVIARGLEIGFEVVGNRAAMLEASKIVLNEVTNFIKNPPEVSTWQGSIRPRSKPRKKPTPTWPEVLPPLINFLSELQEPTVKIFNHHQ